MRCKGAGRGLFKVLDDFGGIFWGGEVIVVNIGLWAIVLVQKT
jgi:hypothetical protein